MHMILLVLGLVCVLAGIGMIVFGIPDSAFGLGNTLIMSGVIAIVGGLGLIGLGSVVSQLRRIRDAIETQKIGSGIGSIEQPADRVMVKPMPIESEGERAAAGARDKARSGPAENADTAKPEPVVAAPGIAPEIKVKPERQDSASQKTEWPQVDTADRPAPVDNPSAPPPAAEAPTANGGTSAGAAEGAPTILKSGVIEGMAYTLYSDGSIEAELAGGTKRFGSIPELRAYLRDNP
jgi:hypothetical protein